MNDIVNKHINRFTGLVCPYVTPANAVHSKGQSSTHDDPTVQSDYEPISVIVSRIKHGDLSALRESSDLGYEYDSFDDNLVNEEDADDYIDQEADVLDKQIDLENYINQKTAEAQQAKASASAGSTNSSNEKRADEARNDAKEASFEETE